jgi:hypothetical protein
MTKFCKPMNPMKGGGKKNNTDSQADLQPNERTY